jgi:hypothetical protein
MSRILKAIAGLVAIVSLSSPAGAQGVLTQKNVSLGLAQAIAQAAFE